MATPVQIWEPARLFDQMSVNVVIAIYVRLGKPKLRETVVAFTAVVGWLLHNLCQFKQPKLSADNV